ncbi:MAG TPA: response regulator [bacterium]|nr:response regulator [bacterium]
MKNVLLIDDDIYNQENLKMNIIPSGNNIDCAKTAKKGLEYINKKKYDLIISEVRLPDQNGFSLAQKIKSMGQNGKYIMLTDFMSKDIKDKVKKLKIDKLVQKPYYEPDLYRTIREMLNN